MVALCALTRPELLILVVVFAPLWLPARFRARRLLLTVVFLASAAVLVGPWVGRNLHDYSHTEIISSNFGSVIVGANCGPTYAGPLLGAWDATCATSLRPPIGDASVVDNYYRSVGEHYARAHLHRVPTVVAARLGRALGVWPAPSQAVTWNATAAGVWPRWSSWLYLITWLLSIPLAIVGAIDLRRRRMAGWPLYALIVLYFVVSGCCSMPIPVSPVPASPPWPSWWVSVWQRSSGCSPPARSTRPTILQSPRRRRFRPAMAHLGGNSPAR